MTKAAANEISKDTKSNSTRSESRGSRAAGQEPPYSIPRMAPPASLVTLQRKVQDQRPAPIQKYKSSGETNSNKLPTALEKGVAHLSGMAMDDVQVHYNSSKPAQLKALAYTQGTNIYVGPGQESSLPHEAWHVVQQKQGRVEPTLQMKSQVLINDDQGLEHEADVMGARANELGSRESNFASASPVAQMASPGGTNGTIQCDRVKYVAANTEDSMADELEEFNYQTKLKQQFDINYRMGKLGMKRPAEPLVPWVQAGDLYVGITQTGSASWPPIVEDKFEEGVKTKFTIFTGTHGNVGGQYLDANGWYQARYQELNHAEQDERAALAMKNQKIMGGKSKYPNLEIEIIDVFDLAKKNSDVEDKAEKDQVNFNLAELQKAIKEELASGRVVILAWCFSLEALTEANGPDKNGNFKALNEDDQNAEIERIKKRQKMPIKDIFVERFGAVEDYGLHQGN